MEISIRILIFIALLPSLLVAADARGRGYTARACGLDLDDDGAIGETTDCTICDGNPDTGSFTRDPDGDGTNEDISFVDTDHGADTIACGAPDGPCATLRFVLEGRNSAYPLSADGNMDGAEDVVCLAGTDKPIDVTVNWKGVAGYRTKLASNSEEWDFRYPTDPAMIVGWDQDTDGEYPPYDPDDSAVLDGDNSKSAFNALNFVNSRYFEIAHLQIKNYGVDYNYSDPSYPDHIYRGLFLSGGRNEYFYAHDIEAEAINKNSCRRGAIRIISNLGEWSYAAFENWQCTECAGYFIRGGNGVASSDPGHIRIKNLTFFGYPPRDENCDPGYESSIGSKPWGPGMDFSEWLDSKWYLDPNGRAIAGEPPGNTGVGPNQCTRYFLIRNNYFEDFQAAVRVAGSDPVNCLDRQTTGPVFIDKNEFVATHQYATVVGVLLHDPNEEGSNRTEGVYITNNVFRDSGPAVFNSALHVYASNAEHAYVNPVLFANNTIRVSNGLHTAAIHITKGKNHTYPINRVILENNTIESGGTNDTMILTDYPPTAFTSDLNRFCSQGTPEFDWNNTGRVSLSSWRTASGSDGNSVECRAHMPSDAPGIPP